MAQLLKHYLIDRDNPGVFATRPEQFLRPLFGTVGFNVEGLVGVHSLSDENGVQFFLATCPDTTVIQEVEGLQILTQAEWDAEIAAYDSRQELKRRSFIRKYRDQLLQETDWIVIRAKETDSTLSTEFKNWRQSLRDLPASVSFPIDLPAAPTDVSVSDEIYTSYVSEIRGVHLVNDPLPPLPEPESTPI